MEKKVYELAIELGMTSKELLELLKIQGIPAESYASVLDKEAVGQVKEFLGIEETALEGDAEETVKPQPEERCDAGVPVSQPEQNFLIMDPNGGSHPAVEEAGHLSRRAERRRKKYQKKAEKEAKKQWKKQKKMIRPGVKRKPIIFLWALLAASLAFGIYKNFTAVDQHTVHEKQVVDKQLRDTNKIENFVRSFVTVYHSWERGDAALASRQEKLKHYLDEELQTLNKDDVGNDVQNSSKVTGITIWDIAQENGEYRVTYEVVQDIIRMKQETVTKRAGKKTIKGKRSVEEKKSISSAYSVVVHMDRQGNMVIVKNPTMTSLPGKSGYEPKTKEEDGSVDADTRKSVESFLKTFFKLYPQADSKELSFYVKDGVMRSVKKNYEFSEIYTNVMKMDGDDVTVSASVRYINRETNQNMMQQFDLTLKRVDDNWKIIKQGGLK